MTTEFGRRAILAMSGAALFQLTAPAIAMADNPEDDERVFSRLSGLFVTLVNSTNLIAEGITKIKFSRFLNSMIGPLSDIAQQKRAVLSALQLNACGSDAARFRTVARASTQEIELLVGELRRNVSTLATAIKPGGTRQLALQIELEMRNVINEKFWTGQIDRYCEMTIAEQTRFRESVAKSSASVSKCRADLENLLDKLSS